MVIARIAARVKVSRLRCADACRSLHPQPEDGTMLVVGDETPVYYHEDTKPS